MKRLIRAIGVSIICNGAELAVIIIVYKEKVRLCVACKIDDYAMVQIVRTNSVNYLYIVLY